MQWDKVTKGNTYNVEKPCFFSGFLLLPDSQSASSINSSSVLSRCTSLSSIFMLSPSLFLSLSKSTLSFPSLLSLLRTWTWLVLLDSSSTNTLLSLGICTILSVSPSRGNCDLWPGPRLRVKDILGCCLAVDKRFKTGDLNVVFTCVSVEQEKGALLVLAEDHTVTGVCDLG